jgi:hypothetical protein
MQSAVLDYHTIHHLTHTAVTTLASYWTARLRYLLLTIFLFKSLSVINPSHHQWFLDAHWAFKPTTHGYEPSINDASKAKEYTKNVQLQHIMDLVQHLIPLSEILPTFFIGQVPYGLYFYSTSCLIFGWMEVWVDRCMYMYVT